MNYTITTNRLNLRPPEMEDAESLFLLMSDESLTKFLTWLPHSNVEVTKELIHNLILSQKDGKAYHWCVCLNNIIIGFVSLIDVRRSIRTWTIDRAEISYWIGANYQNKGYASEASAAIIQFGFENLLLHKIIVAHALENIESQKICSKLGFTQYAHEHDAFKKNNKWHDLIWYELIKQ